MSTQTAVEAPLLQTFDLRCTIDTPSGQARILDGIDLIVRRGETLGIVGESGSGKSMLARVLMNLQTPKAEVSGSVLLGGEEIVDRSPGQMRKLWGTRIAMVFQDSATTFNPVVRIGRQLTEAMRTQLGIDRSAAHEKAVRLLERVRIPEPERRMRQYPHELSGGMRQRVAIAMAIACDPELIIADEATTALDVTVQQQILDLLQELQSERNMAMILISHDLGVISGRADRIAVMYGGTVVETAPAASIFTTARHRYTRALLQSIPTLDRPRHAPLDTIPGTPPRLYALPPGCRFAPRCAFADDACATPPPITRVDAEHWHACVHPDESRPIEVSP